jgi:hypothetical protein
MQEEGTAFDEPKRLAFDPSRVEAGGHDGPHLVGDGAAQRLLNWKRRRAPA